MIYTELSDNGREFCGRPDQHPRTRKEQRRVLVALIVAALVLIGGAVRAETFRYASFVPEASNGNQAGAFPLMEKITAATDGRINFSKFVGGTLLSAPATLKGIRDGIADIAWLNTMFYVNDLPHVSFLTEMTAFGTDPMATLGAANELLFLRCPECLSDFAKVGVVAPFMVNTSPLHMVCTKPVVSTPALKGLRLSALGMAEMRLGSVLGMTPRRQNFAETVQAIQLGQSDCWTTQLSWVQSYGLADNIKFIIDEPLGILSGAIPFAFNKKAWDKISQEDKELMRRRMAEWARDFVQGAYIDDEAKARISLAAKGISFVAADTELPLKYKQFREGELTALKSLAARRGIANPDSFVAEFVTVFEKWHNELLPKFKGNREEFAKILDEEVFSKIKY